MLTIISLVLGNWKTFLIGGIVAFGVGWLLWEKHELIQQGIQQEIQEMNNANAKSKAAADGAQGDVDSCFNGGGTWDRALGVCDHPAGQ